MLLFGHFPICGFGCSIVSRSPPSDRILGGQQGRVRTIAIDSCSSQTQNNVSHVVTLHFPVERVNALLKICRNLLVMFLHWMIN